MVSSRSAETRTVAEKLGTITPATLAARFDAAKLDAAEIYPEIWRRDGKEGLEYITENYDALREFMKTAAGKGMGVLVCIV